MFDQLSGRALWEWALYVPLAILPGAVWLHSFWRRDRFEPEPRELVVRVFLMGAALVPAAATIQCVLFRFLFPDLPGPHDTARLPQLVAYSFLVVGASEEILKYLIVRLRMMPDPEFDEPVDGIIYSVSCALGFATAENLIYMFQYGALVLVIRTLFSVFLHAACSGLCGYYLGQAKFRPGVAGRLQLRGLLVAILIHGLYDFVVFRRLFYGLAVIVVLLYVVKVFLDQRINEAVAESPFRDDARGA